MKQLPIHESFFTWQGEGVHMGRSAFFIRTFGCPVKCPWCDSAGTWHPDYIPKDIERQSPIELAEMSVKHNPDCVVITGGEPAIHDLTSLTTALHERGLKVHLETSGAFPLQGDFDWVTVSPKWQKMPLEENLRRADEIKIIVESDNSIDRWNQAIHKFITTTHVWLHPEWSQRDDPSILRSITEWAKAHGSPFRPGYQLHKLYHADLLDSRSRSNVPLGGNQKLGF
ncbi:7-carboxy-7-deazaguanine synthase QueE [Coraliomargarita sp. SDUM461003]|uniref:7-carboxy-7-deazaguanine synthase n=1 Tax=Thalassobacterium maritimum TaxID=3041265 RepID=A0ABU1AR93_9BACT|nr:7-carboxy-7-deazaguanine synthase QueE [Coraliomargarita sp. SDUM461003]MDQ8206671.1 7-carboxy-7-deazaguanine synthase QueE [Coraliomargarita sp. SDUM461003]